MADMNIVPVGINNNDNDFIDVPEANTNLNDDRFRNDNDYDDRYQGRNYNEMDEQRMVRQEEEPQPVITANLEDGDIQGVQEKKKKKKKKKKKVAEE